MAATTRLLHRAGGRCGSPPVCPRRSTPECGRATVGCMTLVDSPVRIVPSPAPLLLRDAVPHPQRAIDAGATVRVRRGVYTPAVAWEALAPWDRYLVRVHAVAATYPNAIFCLESAAALLGLPVFGDPHDVHLLVTHANAARTVAGIRTHRCLPERVLIGAGGLTMTGAADTAVDLARHRHPLVGLTVGDAALRKHPRLTPESLSETNESRRSSRGRAHARWPLTRASAVPETPFESVSRAMIEWLGFPEPELQTTFRTTPRHEDRGDFFWRSARVVGEADGDMKYDGRFGDPRVALRRQRDRDDRLRSQVNAVAHWGWAQAAEVGPLRSILLSAGVRQTDIEDAAALASARRLLTSRSSAGKAW